MRNIKVKVYKKVSKEISEKREEAETSPTKNLMRFVRNIICCASNLFSC